MQLDDDSPSIEEPSKSARKRYYDSLQRYGLILAKLPQTQWQRLALNDELCQALVAWQNIKRGPAKKRQAQYIGKCMRSLDEESLTRITTHLTKLKNISK